MSSFNFQITNPEALALIEKIKSGEYLNIIKSKLKPYLWIIITVAIVLLILVAVAIGRAISGRTKAPVFTPPSIEEISSTPTPSKKSTLQPLKDSLDDFVPQLPDPALPTFDSQIDLEPKKLY